MSLLLIKKKMFKLKKIINLHFYCKQLLVDLSLCLYDKNY